MSDKTNEQLEHEAREALVAADLSAKMKQWRAQPPTGGGRGGFRPLFLLLLLLLGGAGWWFWGRPAAPPALSPPSPAQQPGSAPEPPIAQMPTQDDPTAMALKPVKHPHLALALSNYHAPDFAADIRGDAPISQDALNQARQALAANRPAEALDALQKAPAEYETDAEYLKAHALFQLKKYPESAIVFTQLTGSIRYGEAAQWYQILAMLPFFEHRKTLIMSQLQKIAKDDGHSFQQQAKQLLGEL